MECWREMSACFPSLDTGFRGSHRWGVSAAAWKGSWVGWYNHQGETQKDSWYIIQLWGIKISSGMIVLVKFGVNISGREWTLLPHTSYAMVWTCFCIYNVIRCKDRTMEGSDNTSRSRLNGRTNDEASSEIDQRVDSAERDRASRRLIGADTTPDISKSAMHSLMSSRKIGSRMGSVNPIQLFRHKISVFKV